MEGWQAGFYAAVLKFLHEHDRPEATEVVEIDDYADTSPGGCPTCNYGPDYQILIDYRVDGERFARQYTYQGDLASFMREIT